jgi:hypothetical protein
VVALFSVSHMLWWHYGWPDALLSDFSFRLVSMRAWADLCGPPHGNLCVLEILIIRVWTIIDWSGARCPWPKHPVTKLQLSVDCGLCLIWPDRESSFLMVAEFLPPYCLNSKRHLVNVCWRLGAIRQIAVCIKQNPCRVLIWKLYPFSSHAKQFF